MTRTARVAVFTASSSEGSREFVVPGVWTTEDMTSERLEKQQQAWVIGALLGAKVEWREFPIQQQKDGSEGVRFNRSGMGVVIGPRLPKEGLKILFLAGPEIDKAEDAGDGKRPVVEVRADHKTPDGKDPWADEPLEQQKANDNGEG